MFVSLSMKSFIMLTLSSMLLLHFAAEIYAGDTPLVEILNGWLRGTHEKSYTGRTFSIFEGVPYARPPIGELRFEVAQEPFNWTGIWNANTKHTCIQSYTDLLHGSVTGDEDCLYVNVYVPREKPTQSNNLDVIIHFHGGAFMVESGHSYAGPKYLMDKEVILITMNYRLGPFGFLSTDDDIQPGNIGMKDQIASLKWIQNNIKFFGGNPESVTLTGMSAGGASVHLHYFSQLSKGLFHRGFSESGTALNSWVIHDASFDRAKRLAELVGCPKETSKEIIDCLKTRPARTIADACTAFAPADGFPIAPFGPTIEKEHPGAFLTEHPHKMLIEKRVSDLPWILSVAEKEMSSTALHFSNKLDELYQEFNKYAPYIFDYYTLEEKSKNLISSKIKKRYFEDTISVEGLGNLLGDRLFISGAAISAKLQSQANKSPVYFYILGYKGQHGVAEYFVGIDLKNSDACHGDGILYYFNTPISEDVLTPSDEKMKDIYLQWLSLYANNKTPEIDNVNWSPVKQHEKLHYLYVQSPNKIYTKIDEDLGSNSFWDKLPFQESYSVAKDEL